MYDCPEVYQIAGMSSDHDDPDKRRKLPKLAY